MTAVSGWDADLAPAERRISELIEPAERRYTGLLHTWEEWLSFALLAVSQLAFALSIARANWVDEMPSLLVATAFGVVVGAALARIRFSAWLLFPAGLAVGSAIVVGMVMQTMVLGDPLAGTGIDARWSELWARVGDWVTALVTGGVSSDPLPFVLLMVFVVFVVPYVAAWAVFRWQSAWLALVPAGVAILTNISYLPGKPSLEFIVFLFAAMLLFTRLHLLRTVRSWSDREIALPSLLSLEVLHASAWFAVGVLLLAWLIPSGNNWGPAADAWSDAIRPVTDRVDRFGQVFIGIDGSGSQLLHSFEGALPLQGRVRLDDETMFIVTPGEDIEGVPNLRANVYDEYTRGGWRLSDTDREPLPGTTVEAASFGTPETREQFRRPVAVEIFVESPLSDRRLLSVGDPLATDIEAKFLTGAAPGDLVGLRPDSRVESGDSYTTVGTISAADVELLVTAGTDYPEWVRERYLQLPSSLPDRVRELAAEVAGDAGSPYLAALQVEAYLRLNYAFNLRISDPPPRRDPVDYFLFESGEGYFDHHASAMAVMLRSLGIPARVAVGFSLDAEAFDEGTRAFVLSEADSWTWPEVYFPGLGWVEFNPTPVRETVARPGPSILPLTGPDSGDTDEFEVLMEAELPGFFSGEPSTSGVSSGGSGGGLAAGMLLVWLVALVAATAVILLVARTAWDYPQRRLAPATVRWAKIQRLSGWAGVRTAPNRTPLEAAAELRLDLEAEEELEPLARAYTHERYGGPNGAAEEEDDAEAGRLDALYRRIRNRLWRETLLRRLGLRRRSG